LQADTLGRTLQLMGSRFLAFAACALIAIAARAFAQPVSPESGGEAGAAESAWTFVVIELRYADAEHVASVLRDLLPPTIKVVPYRPTNSVLIAGDPAVLGDIEARDGTKGRTNN
jgi:type II secretory pathway component GspD/PulD (secretin)